MNRNGPKELVKIKLDTQAGGHEGTVDSGEKPTPLKVNQLVEKVEAGRDIRKNLERIRNAGGKCRIC